MQVSIKQTTGDAITLTIDENATVAELKLAICAEKSDLEPGMIKLIFAGRILADANTLASYQVKDGSSVHMVVSRQRAPAPPPAAPQPAAAPAPQPAPQLGPMQPGGGFGGMFGDVGQMQGLLQAINPQMLQQMMSSPALQRMMNDPMMYQMAQRMMTGQPVDWAEMMRAPGMQEVMRDFMGNGFPGMPFGPGGGMPPFGPAAAAPAPAAVPGPAAAPAELVKPALLQALLGRAVQPADHQAIQQRPQVRGPVQQLLQAMQTCRTNGFMVLDGVPEVDRLIVESLAALNQAGGAWPFGAMGVPAAFAPAQAPRAAAPAQAPPAGSPTPAPAQQYATQLASLAELGFTNTNLNLQALQASGGQIEGAIDFLLAMQGR